jgi:hypothetical protein
VHCNIRTGTRNTWCRAHQREEIRGGATAMRWRSGGTAGSVGYFNHRGCSWTCWIGRRGSGEAGGGKKGMGGDVLTGVQMGREGSNKLLRCLSYRRTSRSRKWPVGDEMAHGSGGCRGGACAWQAQER